jgi:nucleoside-diphosphate-sugar epimerase
VSTPGPMPPGRPGLVAPGLPGAGTSGSRKRSAPPSGARQSLVAPGRPGAGTSRILLTGATGFLGREVLVRLLAEGREVLALTRPRSPDAAEARARLEAIVADTAPGTSTAGLSVAHGDVVEDGLGLAPWAEAWLAEGPVHVVHGAADVRFDLPWREIERQNVGGTRNVVALARKLAEAGRLHRLDYVSTAYVAGDRRDLAREDELDVGQRPRNVYERSKLLAEGVLRDAMAEGLPATVHRPSIIVGDSRTGRAASFKVLYWPMKIYATGRWRLCFGRPDATIDVVPVDFVAEAMVRLLGQEAAVGRTLHLAAGPEGQSTIGELAGLAERFFGGRPVRYFDPMIYQRWLRPIVKPLLGLVRPDVARRGGVYLPYLIANPSFDTAGLRALLGPEGPAVPRVTDYFETIMRFARETDFGRREPPPALSAG